MALANLKVVGVMGRCNLNHAGTEFHVHVLVRHDGDFAVDKGQHNRLAHDVLIPVVRRIYRQSRIAQHGLRTGGGELNKTPLLAHYRIFHMPEMALLLHMLYLCVGDGGLANRAPVDDAVALVNVALVVELYKHFLHGLGTALVHGKALSLPVGGGTHLLQLVDDASAILLFPVPGPLQEFLPAQVLLVNAFLLQLFDDLDLGGDGGVIRSRLPEGVVSLHPLIADQNILHGVVQRVSHVELPGNVGGRHHNGKGLFTAVHFRVKIPVILPFFVQAVFDACGVVGFSKFFAHACSPFLV